MNTDTAFLELDTFSLAGTSNINANKTNFVFRNVNLKSVMGEMWNKYEKFAIRLTACRYFSPVLNTGSQAYMIQNNIKGFDWINCYDEKYGTSQTYMPIGFIRGSNSGQNVIPVSNQYCFNFRKGKQIIDIEFQITNINTDGGTGVSPLLTSMPEQQYTFTIQPAENNQNEMGYLGLYTTVTSQTGTPPVTWPSKVVSNNVRTYTYYSFDMRLCCREFWDKYDEFEILLGGYEFQGYGNQTAEYVIMPITLTGFNFMNNFTKAGAQTSTSTAVIGITRSGNTGSDHMGNVNTYYSPVQFKKTGDLVTFTLEFDNYDLSGLNGNAVQPNRIGYLPFFIRPIKKDMNHQKGLLSVSSAGLTTSQTDLGIRNNAYTDITINNVDLRQACESFWDKYNKFNIFFTCMFPYDQTNSVEERCLMLYCEGLQLVQQMLDSNPQQTTQVWNVGPVYMNVQNVSGVFYPLALTTYGNTHSTTFYKSNDRVNLRFYVKEVGTLTDSVTSQALRGTMTFTIVPVEE
jgi:hypothetical protein